MGVWGTHGPVVSEKSTCSTVQGFGGLKQGGKPGRRRVTVFPKFGETTTGFSAPYFGM
jgi:hypothetical protein